jgi:hypothetical protein
MNELTIRLIQVDFTVEDAIEMDLGQITVLSKNAADLTFNTVFRYFNIELYSAMYVLCVIPNNVKGRPCYKIFSCAFSNDLFWKKQKPPMINLFNTRPNESNLVTIYFTSIMGRIPVPPNDCIRIILLNNLLNANCIQNDELIDNGYKETFALGSSRGYDGSLKRCSDRVGHLTIIYGDKLREFIHAKIVDIREC